MSIANERMTFELQFGKILNIYKKNVDTLDVTEPEATGKDRRN